MALALHHTYSLKGLAEGWTDECKVIYNAVKYADLKTLQTIDQDKITAEQAIDQTIKFVQDHFVSGKGVKVAEDGTAQIVDLVKEDIADLPLEVITKLFNEMNGGKLDPKDIPEVAPSEPQLAPAEAPTTTS